MRWPRRTPRDKTKWRPWFAWRPVVIGDEWVWWEWVERRDAGFEILDDPGLYMRSWDTEYRFPSILT